MSSAQPSPGAPLRIASSKADVPISDQLIAPDVTGVERSIDPVVSRDISTVREFIPEATDIIDRNSPELEGDNRLATISRLARMKRDDAFATQDPNQPVPQGGVHPNVGAMHRGLSELVPSVDAQKGSTLDALGLGGLRNPETVGDIFPAAGAMVSGLAARYGAGPLRKVLPALPQPVVKVVDRALKDVNGMVQRRALPPLEKMLIERGEEAVAGMVGGAIGGMMDVRLEDAARYINNGGNPEVFGSPLFTETPVLGAFIAGNGASPFAQQVEKFINRGVQDATIEAAGFGAGQGLMSSVKKTVGLLAGSEKFLRQMVDDAMKAGVPVGIVDVTSGGVASMTRKIVSVFGLLGGEFKVSLDRSASLIKSKAGGMATGLSTDLAEIMRLAKADPEEAARLVGRLNSGVFKRFAGAFDVYVGLRNRLWDDSLQIAESEGLTVIPAATRATAAAKLSRFFKKGLPGAVKRTANIARDNPKLSKSEINAIAQDALDEFPASDDVAHLEKIFDFLERLEPEPTVPQMAHLGERLNIALADVKSRQAKRALLDIITAVEDDLNLRTQGGSDAYLKARRRAKRFTEEWITLLNGRAGKKVGRVTSDFGTSTVQFVDNAGLDEAGEQVVKNAGTTDPTEFIDMLMDNASIGEIEQIRGILKLSGPEGKIAFKDAVGRRMQKAFRSAFSLSEDTLKLDAGQVGRELGLDDPAGKKRAAFVRAFSLAGGNPKDVDRLIKLSAHIFRDGVPNSSQFAARRAVLGGFFSGAAASGLLFLSNRNDATTITGSVASTLAFVALGRGAARLLTDPANTRSLLQLLDPKFSNSVKTVAARRLASLGFFGTLTELQNEENAWKAAKGKTEDFVEVARQVGANFLRATARDVEPTAVEAPLPLQRDPQGAAVPGASVDQALPAQRR